MLDYIQLKFVTNIKIEIYKIVQNVSNLSDKLEMREMGLKRQKPQFNEKERTFRSTLIFFSLFRHAFELRQNRSWRLAL
jgi:hypothetical protein